MASYRKRGRAWRVEVCHDGTRKSATFDTKAEAEAWAAEQRMLAKRGGAAIEPPKLHDLIERYKREVSPRHKGEKWECLRLDKLKAFFANNPRVTEGFGAEIVRWRTTRLQEVSQSSVRRDMNVFHAMFHEAVRDWKVLQSNPMTGIYKPPQAPHRERLISDGEVAKMIETLGTTGKMGEVSIAFQVALETAMRAGEILSLTPERVKGRVALLRNTKNGDNREVPLSKKAVELLTILGNRFSVSTASLDAMFRKARAKASLSGFTFHDSRATALTRLSKKLDILELARMVGHRDPRSLMIYYRKSAADIAERLD